MLPFGTVRRLAGDRRGSSAVEFAMVFPLLLVLMLGVIVIGQAFYVVSSVQWAIERSSRELMIDSALTGEQLEEKVSGLLANLTDLAVDIEVSDDGGGVFPVTRVFTEIHYPVLIPLVPSFDMVFRVENFVPRPYRPAGA